MQGNGGCCQYQRIVEQSQSPQNREHNALDQLKIGVISGVLLNLVLYKVETVYQLIKRKYHMDFVQLGAGTEFEQSINTLKSDFIRNLPSFRSFLVNEIGNQIFKISLTEMTNPQKIRKQFQKMIQLLYKQSMDIKQKVRPRKTQFQQTKQFKIASNYYRTTKQYMEQPKKAKPARVFGFLASPMKLLYHGVKSLLKTPEEVMTNERYQINQYFYVLPLKKYKNNVNWPSLQSKYLFGMVLDELINFFYSINFNIVSQKRTQYNFEFFMNRVCIYFEKKAKCTEKKFMEMLPILHKIIQQQFTSPQKQALFHDRQLFQAFRETKFAPPSKVAGSILSHALDPAQPQKLKQHRLRNQILKQIYLKNQIQHLEKDMQAKLYSERDGLVIEVVGSTGKLYEGKDDIQKFMELNQKADVEGDTKGQMRMMLDLANQ